MIVDCNATVGRWPFRRLPHSSPAEYVRVLDELGITQAWVSPFEGIFYHAVHEANEQLAQELCGLEDRLIQMLVVNPNYPGWEDDLADGLTWASPGFRVYPGYHGYRLDDEAFVALAERVASAGRMLQVVVQVQDERHQHHLARVAPVDLAPLPHLLERLPQLSVMVLNAPAEAIRPLALPACPANLSFDISHVEGVGGVGELAGQIGTEHLVLGTHATLLYPHSALLKLVEADLEEEARQMVLGGNALRLLGC